MTNQASPASDNKQRLEKLILAQHRVISISTLEEEEALQVVRDTALERGLEMWLWSMSKGIRDGLLVDGPCVPDTDHPAAAMFHWMSQEKGGMCVMLDVAGHLKDERTLRLMRDLIAKFEKEGSYLILIDSQGELPPAVQSRSTVFELSLPDEKRLEIIIRDALRARNEISRVQVELSRKGLQTIIKNLRGLSARQARQVVLDSVSEDNRFDISDINKILAGKRKMLQGMALLEFIQSPVDLTQIGGLVNLKQWLTERQDALSDEAAAYGLSGPRGVLMLGVQGAGKSLSAKAVATAWQRPLLRMDVGALYDKYIGESERRLRDALHQAEAMSPIVLWIDEIEKAFASAAAQSSDGGLSKRMFGSLLTWMQEHDSGVFLVATANDIEALPPELLRKGRFDEIFFVDLPGLEARKDIFAIHLRMRKRDPQKFDLAGLAAAADGFSGAEIEQAIISALHQAYAQKSELNNSLILKAMEQSPPLSVTMAEKVQALRDWASGRCLGAG
ncbi:MAG: AAA family ATPase [Phycisphaerales bacterium]|jgi:ATP-dependent 26S proteasome regulatory subunit|nr:AAA family ATPase [Phycisphaerales bacterium]